MNMKMNCIRCGERGLKAYRMVLMMGPKGFRRYAMCLACADGKPPRKKTRKEVNAESGKMSRR